MIEMVKAYCLFVHDTYVKFLTLNWIKVRQKYSLLYHVAAMHAFSSKLKMESVPAPAREVPRSEAGGTEGKPREFLNVSDGKCRF